MNEVFEREKTSFEQNSESIRHLNEILWKIPLIAMTLTGGLWYGIATTNALPPLAIRALLVLTALTDISLIIVLLRVRSVMGQYIEQARAFNPTRYPDAEWGSKCKLLPKPFRKWLVVWVFSLLLLVAGGMSLYGACALTDALRPAKISTGSQTRP